MRSRSLAAALLLVAGCAGPRVVGERDLADRGEAVSPEAPRRPPAEEAVAAAPSPAPPAERSPYHEHPSTLLGKTIRYEAAAGATDELLVLWVEGTKLTGYRPADRQGETRIEVDVEKITILEVRRDASDVGKVGNVVLWTLGAALKIGVMLILMVPILLL